MTAFKDFYAAPSPAGAVRLAREDHMAGPLPSFTFTDHLDRAAKMCDQHARLVDALKALLVHEGERHVNGIGLESDSEALELAKNNAEDILKELQS